MNVRDQSGFVVFSKGDVGAAHVMAHQLLDSGQVELGHERLGRFLKGRDGAGSDWAHIQFHMAIFELAVGDWKAAYARFLEELLPIAATSQDALTDAPALAWRLALQSEGGSDPLPWEDLRRTALSNMARNPDPFVAMHNLLALAGADDSESIGAWLEAHRADTPTRSSDVLVRMAGALGAYARRNYRCAAGILRDVVPELPSIGGSWAQNQLFTEMQARVAVA